MIQVNQGGPAAVTLTQPEPYRPRAIFAPQRNTRVDPDDAQPRRELIWQRIIEMAALAEWGAGEIAAARADWGAGQFAAPTRYGSEERGP